jgi:hypothetical protein
MEIKLHTFLTSVLDGDKLSASHPSLFLPGLKKKKKLQYLPQSWSRHHGDNKNPSLTGNQTPTAELIASCFTYFRCYFRCSENIREEKYSVCTPKI